MAREQGARSIRWGGSAPSPLCQSALHKLPCMPVTLLRCYGEPRKTSCATLPSKFPQNEDCNCNDFKISSSTFKK
eukprot:6463391-Amphidinium_carterae.1